MARSLSDQLAELVEKNAKQQKLIDTLRDLIPQAEEAGFVDYKYYFMEEVDKDGVRQEANGENLD